MKTKRLLSIVLALVMLLSVAPLAVFAAEEHTHAMGLDCSATEGEQIEYLPFDNNTDSYIYSDASYYLTEDIVFDSTFCFQVYSGATLNLCLNGHSINTTVNYYSVLVYEGGTVNICDCAGGDNQIRSDYAPTVYVEGTANLYGVHISSGNTGIRAYENAEVNLYGCEITDCNSYGVYVEANASAYLKDTDLHNNKGTALYTYGSITADGCKIYDNTSSNNGAGIYVSSSGSAVLKNTKLYRNTGNNGSAICSYGYVSLDGCEIYGNNANKHGAVYLPEGNNSIKDSRIFGNNVSNYGVHISYQTNISGLIVIDGNVVGGSFNEEAGIYEGGTPNNMFFNNPNYTFTVDGALAEGSVISVINDMPNVIARGDGTNVTTLEGCEKYFRYDNGKYIAAVNANGEIYGKSFSVTAPSADSPEVVLPEEYAEGATYEWYENGMLMEGETDNAIVPDVGNSYTVIVTLASGIQTKYSFSTAPQIVTQPTESNPTFVVSMSDRVEKYEWYATTLEEIKITDANASNVCTNCEGNYTSTYDAENDLWTGAKACDAGDGCEVFYFSIELDEGETIYIDASPEISEVKIFDYENTAGFTPSFSLVGNIQVFTADYAGSYAIFAIAPDENVKISAFKLKKTEHVLLEDETSSTLSNITAGWIYNCVAVYDETVSLTSNRLIAYPEAVTQPDMENGFNFDVNFKDIAEYQWYEYIDEDTSKALDGETSNTLSAAEFGKKYYCLAKFPYGMNVKSDEVSLQPEIVTQPSASDPTVEVTFEEYVSSYQWYAGIPVSEAVTSSDTYDEYGSYDEDTGLWTGYVYDYYEYDDYTEYETDWFEIWLNEGDVVKVTFDDASVISPDNEFRFSPYDYGTEYVYPEDDGKTFIFEAPYDDYYYLYNYTIAENVTAKFEIVTYEYEPIEGETEKTLSSMEVGNKYGVEVIYTDDIILYSDVFATLPEITKQPSASDPTVEVTFEDDAKYQWLEATQNIEAITSSDVDYEYGSYDGDTELWSAEIDGGSNYGSYTEYRAAWFEIWLNEGDVIKVTFDDASVISPDNEFRFSPYDYGTEYVYPEDDGKTYIFEAPYDDYYYLYNYTIAENVTAKFEIVTYEYEPIEGETEKTLSESEIGKSYAILITYSDGTELISEVFEYSYAISKQPTPDAPSVEINSGNDNAAFQWYELVFENAVELTDENAEGAYYEDESDGEPAYYDEENGYWVPSLYGSYYDDYGTLYYEYDTVFVELEEGQSLILIPSEEITYIEYTCLSDPILYDFEKVGDANIYTAGLAQKYGFYFGTYFEDITFKAYVIDDYYTVEIEGATESELKADEAGVYFCEVTAPDGSVLVSDYVALTEDDLYTLGDVNADGAIDQYDYILVKRHYFETRLLTESELTRADANRDGVVNQFDYILIRRHYFGTYTIG